jgi:hypothetical protein
MLRGSCSRGRKPHTVADTDSVFHLVEQPPPDSLADSPGVVCARQRTLRRPSWHALILGARVGGGRARRTGTSFPSPRQEEPVDLARSDGPAGNGGGLALPPRFSGSVRQRRRRRRPRRPPCRWGTSDSTVWRYVAISMCGICCHRAGRAGRVSRTATGTCLLRCPTIGVRRGGRRCLDSDPIHQRFWSETARVSPEPLYTSCGPRDEGPRQLTAPVVEWRRRRGGSPSHRMWAGHSLTKRVDSYASV